MFFFSRMRHLCLAILVLSIGIGLGCRDPDEQRKAIEIRNRINQVKDETDPLTETFRYMPEMIRLQRAKAVKEMGQNLNVWAKTAPDVNWTKPDLIDDLPSELKILESFQSFDRPVFDDVFCESLFNCQMADSICDWVLANPYHDTLFADWVDKVSSEWEPSQRARLLDTVKLFDWTTRNIFLDGEASDIEQLIPDPQYPLSDDDAGYTQPNWVTLVTAQGDAMERVRVFAQLAMQVEIPVVWIATDFRGINGLSLVGVPVNGEIYLFEPRMGLPLPGPGGVGIATLNQAKSDESILRRAKLPGRFEYCLSSSDLESAKLLLIVDPLAMTKEMSQLEESLTGSQRIQTSIDVKRWQEQLDECAPGVDQELWGTPWLAFDYSRSLRGRLENVTQFSSNYMAKYGLYVDATPLANARRSHLLGEFTESVQKRNAPQKYMDLRVDEESLQSLRTDQKIQAELGVMRMPQEDLEAFERRVMLFQSLYRASKFDAAIFVSSMRYDLGHYQSAASWAYNRVAKVERSQRWHAMAWYVAGRAYESLGDIEQAIEMYKKTPSSMEPGNRIRIRLLEKSDE